MGKLSHYQYHLFYAALDDDLRIVRRDGVDVATIGEGIDEWRAPWQTVRSLLSRGLLIERKATAFEGQANRLVLTDAGRAALKEVAG